MIEAILLAALLSTTQAVVVNPRWETPPSPAWLEEPMPPFAAFIGVDGDVTLQCIAPARIGPLEQCRAISTSVTGMGFEAKAIEVTTTGIMLPQTVDGVARPARTTFVVRFRAEDWKADRARYSGPEPSLEQMRLARALVVGFGEWADLNKYEAYPELEPVRRARVNLWERDLFPIDGALEEEMAATFFARLMSESELKTALTTGQSPSRQPSVAEIEKAMVGLEGGWDEAAIETLRERYCAEYDCGQKTD